MNSKIIRTTYLSLFAILYLCTAFVSTMHAIQFFSLANAAYLGVILALTFEVSQAAVLSSLLIDKSNQKKIVPWLLMFLMCGVQILGNVYSSYKYICLNSLEDLKWFKEPIFIWMDNFPDKEATVIVTWAIGGLLPCVCLLLTEMVTSYIHRDKEENKVTEPTKQEEIKEDKKEEPEPEPEPEPELEPEQEHKIENEQVQEQTNQKEETIKEYEQNNERYNNRSKESEGVVNDADEGDTQNLTKEEAKPDVSEPEISKPNLKSQFLNI